VSNNIHRRINRLISACKKEAARVQSVCRLSILIITLLLGISFLEHLHPLLNTVDDFPGLDQVPDLGPVLEELVADPACHTLLLRVEHHIRAMNGAFNLVRRNSRLIRR
jgi:hypothetical protein